MVLVWVSGTTASVASERDEAAPARSLARPTFAPSLPAALSLVEFRAVLERRQAQVLDVRPDLDYRRGHIPGALSLPGVRFQAGYAKLKARLESDRSQAIVLYCGSVYCDESERMQGRLLAMGFTRVSLFPEGWAGWRAAGLAEEKVAGADAPLEPWRNSAKEKPVAKDGPTPGAPKK